MRLKGVKVGFAITGSFCTIKETVKQLENVVKEGAVVTPIVSHVVKSNDTRFGDYQMLADRIKEITGNDPITSIIAAEPIGPKKLLDVIVLAPCTGNTIAKLAWGVTDGPVLMAAKAHLRNLSPVVIAISTNDGLGMSAKNLGILINSKNIYFVPFGQDSPQGKPNSLKSDMNQIVDTIEMALEGKQLQPVIITF